ncbi:hypothetical protein ACIA49_38525 [Kribbella sp. NPDC051587]|uniref:hypothetical protein n=1 Tax=Kribbella sp. NPDC051587 TaxID=3364119 RepID=UPI0037ABCB0E
MRNGYLPSGATKVRACCSCGYTTTPHTSEEQARHALLRDHPLTRPVCVLCGTLRLETDGDTGRLLNLEILNDRGPDNQILVCTTDLQACHDAAAQRQLHLDRTAFEAFDLDYTPPRLRSIPDQS